MGPRLIREKYRAIAAIGHKSFNFCPKTTDFASSQGFNSDSHKFPCKPQILFALTPFPRDAPKNIRDSSGIFSSHNGTLSKISQGRKTTQKRSGLSLAVSASQLKMHTNRDIERTLLSS